MGFATRLVNGGSSASGTFTGVNSGSSVNGTTLQIDQVEPHTLSALATLLAETNTVTLSAYWQVSADQTTWYNVINQVNSTFTVEATGTAGADTAVSKVIDAPPAVYGWRFCRLSVLVGGTNATVNDTYAISYSYAKKALNG
jgi:hypothetical protein